MRRNAAPSSSPLSYGSRQPGPTIRAQPAGRDGSLTVGWLERGRGADELYKTDRRATLERALVSGDDVLDVDAAMQQLVHLEVRVRVGVARDGRRPPSGKARGAGTTHASQSCGARGAQRSSAADFVTPWMFFGMGRVASVTHAAGFALRRHERVAEHARRARERTPSRRRAEPLRGRLCPAHVRVDECLRQVRRDVRLVERRDVDAASMPCIASATSGTSVMEPTTSVKGGAGGSNPRTARPASPLERPHQRLAQMTCRTRHQDGHALSMGRAPWVDRSTHVSRTYGPGDTVIQGKNAAKHRWPSSCVHVVMTIRGWLPVLLAVFAIGCAAEPTGDETDAVVAFSMDDVARSVARDTTSPAASAKVATGRLTRRVSTNSSAKGRPAASLVTGPRPSSRARRPGRPRSARVHRASSVARSTDDLPRSAASP